MSGRGPRATVVLLGVFLLRAASCSEMGHRLPNNGLLKPGSRVDTDRTRPAV